MILMNVCPSNKSGIVRNLQDNVVFLHQIFVSLLWSFMLISSRKKSKPEDCGIHFEIILVRYKAVESRYWSLLQAEHLRDVSACADQQRGCHQLLQEVWVWDHWHHQGLLHQYRSTWLLRPHQVHLPFSSEEVTAFIGAFELMRKTSSAPSHINWT